jgi:hypothetical protein
VTEPVRRQSGFQIEIQIVIAASGKNAHGKLAISLLTYLSSLIVASFSLYRVVHRERSRPNSLQNSRNATRILVWSTFSNQPMDFISHVPANALFSPLFPSMECLSASHRSESAISFNQLSQIIRNMMDDIPRMDRAFDWLQPFHCCSFWTGKSPVLSSAHGEVKDLLDDESDDVFTDDLQDQVGIIPRLVPNTEPGSFVRECVPGRSNKRQRIVAAKLTFIWRSIARASLFVLQSAANDPTCKEFERGTQHGPVDCHPLNGN